METWAANRAETKPLNHLLSKLKCLLEKFNRGCHQDHHVVLAIANSILVEVEDWLQTFCLAPPLTFLLLDFNAVLLGDVILQRGRFLEEDVPVLWFVEDVWKPSLGVR